LKKKLIAASNNENKILEIKSILSDTSFNVLSLKDACINVEPKETSTSFEGNAIIKARATAALTDHIVIADDSGLEVDCLDGAPGVISKRFAGINSSDNDNNQYLIKKLKRLNFKRYPARFVCVIAFIDENRNEKTFKGICEGEIVMEPAGDNGFGYDPFFYISELNKTMAQLNDSQKNSISHRGNALKLLHTYLKGINK